MALNFGSGPARNQPSHEDLLAALNAQIGGATAQKEPQNTKFWDKIPPWAKFWTRVVVGLLIQAATFWAVGYVLAWQNLLPFVPEWWHGLAVAAAWWMVMTITPPQVILKHN